MTTPLNAAVRDLLALFQPDLGLDSTVEDWPELRATLDRLREESAKGDRTIELLAHAVKRLGEIESETYGDLYCGVDVGAPADPLIDEARALIKAAQQSDQPAPGNTSR